MKWYVAAAAVLLTAPLATTAAFAQQSSAQTFVEKVAISDLYEVQSGKMAAEKAQNEDVQSFGQEMVDAHTETTEDLRELVKDEEIKVEFPTQLDKDHQAKLDQLNNAGARFDQTYISQQVQAHQQAVKLFEDYSKNGDNEELREWADDTLPTLREHLEDAQALNEDLKAAPAVAEDRSDSKRQMTAEDRSDSKRQMTAEDRTRKDDRTGKDAKRTAPSNIKFVTKQQPKDWSAQALIGRTVYNKQDENLGEINNVILDEKGSVVAVTIGVGGFLGIGEKDVGVPFNALQFVSERQLEKAAGTDDRDANDRQDRTTRYDSEHGNIRIVLTATHEQLEAAPRFVWLGEQDDQRARDDDSVVR